MKIKVEEIPNIETEITIKCDPKTTDVEALVSTLQSFNKPIIGKADGLNYILNPNDIYYCECVDDKIYCYTDVNVYETNLRLYEIENIYSNSSFLRINKTMIVNVNKIASFKSQLNGKMEAILDNREKVEISRNYVASLKQKLGGFLK